MNAIAEMAHRANIVPIFQDRMSERDHAVGVFEAHIAEVEATIAADRSLTFDVAEGWRPLCAFLGVSVPDTAFPKANSTKEFVEETSAEKP